MLTDPRDGEGTWVDLGLFSGVLVKIRPDGHGIIVGYTGPHDVILPAGLIEGRRPGDSLQYIARRPAGGPVIAARVVQR